jgi:hypothetical protein
MKSFLIKAIKKHLIRQKYRLMTKRWHALILTGIPDYMVYHCQEGIINNRYSIP